MVSAFRTPAGPPRQPCRHRQTWRYRHDFPAADSSIRTGSSPPRDDPEIALDPGTGGYRAFLLVHLYRLATRSERDGSTHTVPTSASRSGAPKSVQNDRVAL
jgi:hypothetical protein